MQAARRADVVVAVVGGSSARDFKTKYIDTGAAVVDAQSVSDMEAGEGFDRSTLDLLGLQMPLLEALKATGKPIVLLNFSGRATVMDWEVENIPTILNVWFGGSEAADAICDVVFGDVAPSGKLTVTMPRNVGQIPIYYNHLNTGRPNPRWFTKFTTNYLDVPNDPLFPFGYGLSYTTFKYSPMTLSSNAMNAGGTINATVTVTNTGKVEGTEVVQFYIRDMVGSIARPVQELKGFERISLKPGESRTVTFTINADLLKFYNKDLEYVCEPGQFEAMIGPNSRDVQRLTFTLR